VFREHWSRLRRIASWPPERRRVEKRTTTSSTIAGYEKHLDFAVLAEHHPSARDRALRMQQQADEDGEPHRNPTTGVYRLTDSIARKDDEPGGTSGDG
jgi:hypothetical protein